MSPFIKGFVIPLTVLLAFLVAVLIGCPSDSGFQNARRAQSREVCEEVAGRDYKGCVDQAWHAFTREEWIAGAQ